MPASIRNAPTFSQRPIREGFLRPGARLLIADLVAFDGHRGLHGPHPGELLVGQCHVTILSDLLSRGND